MGTLAAYARQGDHFTFYEINPAVSDLAAKYFTYIGDARDRGATVDLEMGDARLTLERQRRRNSICWCWTPSAVIPSPCIC